MAGGHESWPPQQVCSESLRQGPLPRSISPKSGETIALAVGVDCPRVIAVDSGLVDRMDQHWSIDGGSATWSELAGVGGHVAHRIRLAHYLVDQFLDPHVGLPQL